VVNSIDIDKIIDIALLAGSAVMEIYNSDFEVELKSDNSPLTQADRRSNEIICSKLNSLYPLIPILSEENKEIPYSIRKDWEYYWCIDPIDGTKEFIKKNGEFTINIALIHKDTPILGVVYAPAIKTLYWAKENRAFRADLTQSNNYLDLAKTLPLNSRKKEDTLRVVASKSHMNSQTKEFIDSLEANNIELISKGSSLKLVMVAEGSADIYPRMAPTMEWDTAAADAIVRASNKMSYKFEPNKSLKELEPLRYNKATLLNPWFIVK